MSADTAELRLEATNRRWEKSGIDGKNRQTVTKQNTVMSSGTVEWFVKGVKRTRKIAPHVSGNPWMDFAFKRKAYKGKSPDSRACAEPRVLATANAILRDALREGGIRAIVYLYSEFTPCKVCEGKIKAWLVEHPSVELLIVAHQRFNLGENRSTWEYEESSGYLYLGWEARPDSKEKRYVAPVFKSTPVSVGLSYAAAAVKK